MQITFEIVHTCTSIQNTKPHGVFNGSQKYFTSVSHICFYCHDILLQFINILLMEDIFVLSHQWQLMFPCLVHISYLLHKVLVPIKFKWLSQIFSFGSDICSFTSVITYVFLVWKTSCQELHSIGRHDFMYLYRCTHWHIYLLPIHTYKQIQT